MDWNFRNDQPIYSQLTQRLTEAIVSGIYAPGRKAPLRARACGGGGRQPQHGPARATELRTRRSGVFPAHGGTVRHGK